MHKTTLSNLYARTFLYPSVFPSEDSALRARVALRRIYEALDQSPATIETSDVIALYKDALPESARPQKWQDDLRVLHYLETAPEPNADMAHRVWLGEAHLGDAIEAVRSQPWGGEVQRVIGAIERLARLLDRAPEDIPAIEKQIKRILAQFTGADFGIARSSYPTLRSRIRRAVRLVDTSAKARLSYRSLQGPWRDLADSVRARSQLRGDFAKIWQLMAYCWQRGISPDYVDDDVVQCWKTQLEEQLGETAFVTARTAIYSWERLQREVPEWPKQTLSRLYRNEREITACRFRDLPSELQEIWNNYETAVAKNAHKPRASALVCDAEEIDPFADLDEEMARLGKDPVTYSPSTLYKQRSHWVRCARIFEELYNRHPVRLSDVTDRDVLAQAARQIRGSRDTSGDGQKSGARKGLITDALAWAHHDDCESGHIQVLQAMRDRVDPHLIERTRQANGKFKRTFTKQKMGKTPRERLRQFNNPLNLHTWFVLPDTLIGKAQTIRKRAPDDPHACTLVLIAMLHRILRCAPMRRANLAGLTIGGQTSQLHLPRFQPGRGGILVPANQVKNDAELFVELDEPTMSLIRFWLAEFRPALMKRVGADPDNPFLIPARGMGHRSLNRLSERFTDTNRREADLLLNLHLCRHLTGKLILDRDPSQIAVVQQLLGHKDLETTQAYYAEINAVIAQRTWQRILGDVMADNKKMIRRKAA